MEFKDVASVSGKGGLFKVLKPTRTGVILESMDEAKTKLVTSISSRVSLLDEISIYTHSKEGSIPLKDVFHKINKEFGEDPGVDNKSTPDELKAFLKFIIPDFDEEKVYVSDIKKIVHWYSILLKYAPELLAEQEKKTKKKKEKKDQEGKAEKGDEKDEKENKSKDES